VSLDLSHYLCRCCGAAGDVIAYVRQADDLSFSAACEEIERRAATPRDTATDDLFGGA
jgi:DNA primase